MEDSSNCLIYKGNEGKLIWVDEMRSLISEEKKLKKVIKYLETNVDDDLKFLYYLRTQKLYSELFCHDFETVIKIYRSSRVNLIKPAFVELRKKMIEKKRNRLSALSKEISSLKPISPNDPTAEHLGMLEKERELLYKIKTIKFVDLRSKLSYFTRFYNEMMMIDEKMDAIEQCESGKQFVKLLDERMKFIDKKIVDINRLGGNVSNSATEKKSDERAVFNFFDVQLDEERSGQLLADNNSLPNLAMEDGNLYEDDEYFNECESEKEDEFFELESESENKKVDAKDLDLDEYDHINEEDFLMVDLRDALNE